MRAARPVGALVALATVAGPPLLVAVRIGRPGLAVFGVAWLCGMVLAVVAAGTAWWRVRPGTVHPADAARAAVERGLTVVVPVVVVLLVGSPWILSAFGTHVRDTGVGALFTVALAAVPATVVLTAVRVAWVLGRVRTAAALPLAVLGVALALGWVATSVAGVVGTGIGWLVAQSAAAVVVLLRFRAASRAELTRTVASGA